MKFVSNVDTICILIDIEEYEKESQNILQYLMQEKEKVKSELKANMEYKQFLTNPELYREEKLKVAKQSDTAMNNLSGNSAQISQSPVNNAGRIVFCPKCGSEDITRQVFQENSGSKTVTHTTSKYKYQMKNKRIGNIIHWRYRITMLE